MFEIMLEQAIRNSSLLAVVQLLV